MTWHAIDVVVLTAAAAAANSKKHVNWKIENTFRSVLFGEIFFRTFARCYLYSHARKCTHSEMLRVAGKGDVRTVCCAHMWNNNILMWLISIPTAAAMSTTSSRAASVAIAQTARQMRLIEALKVFLKKWERGWNVWCWTAEAPRHRQRHSLTRRYGYLPLRYHITNTWMHARRTSSTSTIKQKRVGI